MVPSVFADHLSDLEVEVKSQTDIGTVMIEKSEYIIAPREILYVKVFGEIDIDNPVNLPMDYTEFVSFETTNPNGTKFITEVSKTKKGYFENRIPVSYETRGDSPSPFGQYQVYVTFKGNSLGNLTFSVVDKATAEAAAQAAAETKAAAQAAAAQAAAEAKAAAQAAAEAKVAAEAKAEARAEAAQAAAEVRAETAQAATEAKVAAKAAAQTITTIIILAIVATIIVVIVMLARKTWKNQTDQINENYWRNNSKPTKEEPKEEEESTFCTNCGNRLTKAGAKFCRKCGSAQ